MADETIDYSYSSLGSTIELDELASTRPSTPLSSPVSSAGPSISWHPELTLYRLLVILSTVGLAAAKSATSLCNLTFASITLEWILGVVVFLFFYLLGAYEGANNRYLIWLFNVDYMEYLWTFLESLPHFGKRPFYLSDEIDARYQTIGVPPLVTGYQIIVTVLVASFGMTKSALLYGQEPMEATTVECVFGVGIVTGLYCLGLYEASSTKVCPTLFHVDYYDGLLSSISETAIVFLHLFALLPCSALSYFFYTYATMTFSPEGVAEMDGTGTTEIAMLILKGVTCSAVSLGGAMGVLALMHHLGSRYNASPLARFIARRSGISYVHQKYLLPSGHSPRPRPRFFYLKRFIIRQSVKIPANIILLCGVIVVLAYCFCILFLLYSFAVQFVKEGFWPGIYLLVFSFPVVVAIMVVCTVATLIFGYKGVVNYFSDAWKDLTVDIEPGGVPDDEPLEGV